MASDDVTQLRRRLAQEAGDCDAAKLGLHRLKTAVDFYRQRLQALLIRPAGLGPGDNEGVVARAADLVRDMVAEVRNIHLMDDPQLALSAMSPGSPARPGKGYEVLRQSLDEAQRRCESLNNDMVHHAEANEELVETLNTIKDANKRLLEQIRQQNSEIAALTQHRVSDEERTDQMSRRHECDREAIRQETQREVLHVREAGAERHNQVYLRLTDRLRHVRARSDMMMQDTQRLAHELQERRADANAMIGSLASHLQVAERDLCIQCARPKQRHEQLKKETENSISDLSVRLHAEQEAAHSEGLSWGLKLGALATENEDVHTRHTRDFSLQHSYQQALDRTLQGTLNGNSEDRVALESAHEENLRQKQRRKMALDELQRDIVRFETAHSKATSEIASIEQVLVELKRQARESDDALAASLSSNEHLREQMEEQRERFQAKNEADLNDCRSYHEQKLADLQVAHEADMAMSQKQLDAMHDDLNAQHEDFKRHKANQDAVSEEYAILARDLNMWKSQCEAVKSTRGVLEKDFYEGKHLFHGERLKLHAGIEKMQGLVATHGDDLKTLSADLQELRRNATSQETEKSTSNNAAAYVWKETQERIADLKARLKGGSDELARVDSEVATTRERLLDHQVALERELDNTARCSEEERRRVREQYETERRSGELARAEFTREREATTSLLKRVHDESRTKLANVERDRARIHEASRADIQHGSQIVAQQQARIKALEHDLARIQSLQAESESNAHWVRQEQGHLESETGLSLRGLEEDVRQVHSTLDLAKRDEAALSQQIEAQRQRNEQERLNLRRQLELASPSSPSATRMAPFTAR